MRRKISLYIGGSLADLNEQDLVLYNYAFTDLENPTAVKNSYSKQITLPGTPANAAIVGHPARVDRRTTAGGGTGTAFAAGRKTPFTIYNDTGEVLESGYLRLDSVTRKGEIVTGYKVTLFGGLGGFLYSLSYDAEGNKRTLASLVYGYDDLDFTIDAATILEAWSHLEDTDEDDPTIRGKWQVLNFAPAYNGLPEGAFDADKAVAEYAAIGLPSSITEDGVDYYPRNGKVVLSLPAGQDEWAVKDMRSYLQRPVFSVHAFLLAIADPANNGGYAVDLSLAGPQRFFNMWKTLPMLSSLGSFSQEAGDATLDVTGSGSYYVLSGPINHGGTIPDTAMVKATMRFRIKFGGLTSGYEYALAEWGGSIGSLELVNTAVFFVQAIAWTGNSSNVVGYSKAVCISPFTAAEFTGRTLAEFFGATDHLFGDDIDQITAADPFIAWGGDAVLPADLALEVNSYPANYSIYIWSYSGRFIYNTATGQWRTDTGQRDLTPRILREGYVTPSTFGAADMGSTITYSTPGELRSGVKVTKGMLLNSKHTPAEYLVSLAKQFGLTFEYEADTRTIRVRTRSWFFNTQGARIDLSRRVDRSQEITILPQHLEAKWYDLKLPLAEGAFAQEYKRTYGIDYAIQRVNTGYEFDAAVKDLLQGNAFRGAVTALAHGPAWNYVLDGGNYRPSQFLDNGVSAEYYDSATRKTAAYQVPALPSSVSLNYYNGYFPGYDAWDSNHGGGRLQFHDVDGKVVDGEDILCWYRGKDAMPYFKVSDDTAEMLNLNGGKGCWDMTPGAAAGVSVPLFSRMVFSTQFVEDPGDMPKDCEESLDFGIPKELDIPGIGFRAINWGVTLYQRYWRDFLADRLDKDTKVMRCRVDLSGLKVGPFLLRQFYWYEGSLWVLNKITNYSLTTYDPVECEFIQVKDPSNYE